MHSTKLLYPELNAVNCPLLEREPAALLELQCLWTEYERLRAAIKPGDLEAFQAFRDCATELLEAIGRCGEILEARISREKSHPH